jgi:acetylornithine deacetylase/succinyl-diaminopimelate desuccinylase-like protein
VIPAIPEAEKTLTPSIAEILSRIDKDELVRLVLDVCNIDSGGPIEAPVARYVGNWLQAEGFRVRNIGLLAERFNVLARLPGTGGGYSLLLNSHMDTAVRSTDVWSRTDPDADVNHKAWREGDELVGEGVVNDKGPLAAFLIAAKAIKRAGVKLKGDLLLSAVVAETSHEPSDGPPGAVVETLDLGARFLATHGGVADYALIAEGTGFSVVTVEAGMAWYKITWLSDQPSFYTPYLPDRTTMAESPNMIVRAAVAVAALEDWAATYQKKYTRKLGGGVVIPKAQIAAIRSGHSTALMATPQICSLYLGAFTVPGTIRLRCASRSNRRWRRRACRRARWSCIFSGAATRPRTQSASRMRSIAPIKRHSEPPRRRPIQPPAACGVTSICSTSSASRP